MPCSALHWKVEMKKHLQFEIIDNKILNVLDFDWYINDIEMINISHSEIEKNKYAIYLSTSWETAELYFRTSDELLIKNEFKKLCSELNKVNQNFKEYFPRCFNFEKIKQVKKSGLLSHKIELIFNSGNSVEFKTNSLIAKNLTADKQSADFEV